MIKRFCCGVVTSLIFVLPISADSLWVKAQHNSMYTVPQRQVGVGDVVTILISESTSAVQQARTSTEKQSGLNADLLSDWNQIANLLGNERIRKDFDLQLGGGDSYQGSGQTSRSSQVRAVVTAMVTEVLENGNLFIIGEHKVKVNNEVQVIQVSGIVRPRDISENNSVLSSQIARAEVSINGSGVVGAKQNPGLMSKMFNWLF